MTALLCLLVLKSIKAQTAIQTSFESSTYNVGTIHNINKWTIANGNGVIISDVAKSKTGTQSFKLSADNSALLANYNAYSGSVPGIGGVFYTDLWVLPVSFATRGLTINAFDLYGGSSKRIFVVEFTTDNKINAFNGSTATNVGTWSANEWVRLSIQTDLITGKFKIAINGSVLATEFNLRESYIPTASGTRAVTIKEFHVLRFNHSTDSQVATTSSYIDDLYIGTTPITGISFGAASTERAITVTQPEYGSIALSPVKTSYNMGDEVTATLTLPAGYKNNGWTGNLSGTENTKTFTVVGNMTIGASVSVDLSNPPMEYIVTVNPSVNGSIKLSPSVPNNKYYAGTKITATVSAATCFQFNGWTGDLSGSETSKTFTLSSDLNIGAAIGENSIPSVVRTVATVDDIKTALLNMKPGDIIEIENGDYVLGSIKIKRSGCEKKPILIRAKNLGQVSFSGNTTFELDDVAYISMKGFSFQSTSVGTGIKILNSNHIRITENNFAINETSSCNWVYIGDTFASTLPLKSGHNKIDYNVFDGKTQSGKYILLDGTATQQTQYDTISYNIFKNNGPRAVNEKETIRIGVSGLTKSSGFTLVEYNLFEDCDGDPEIVSVKSCDNIIRFNTFRRSLGTLCLRQGSRNVAEGNYFFGEGKTAIFMNEGKDSNGNTIYTPTEIGCGGVRVYGTDHKIINNYFHGLTGQRWDAAITMSNGDVANPSVNNSDHNLPENVLVAFNTFVNNKSNFEIGNNKSGEYPLDPINCVIANNLVIENTAPIIKYYTPTSLNGVTFSNNIMYPTGTSSIGITASPLKIRNIDPKLMNPPCTSLDCENEVANVVKRLSAESPAIDAATGDFPYVSTDFEKVPRGVQKDIGAHEYTGARTVNFTALSEKHAGPNAIPITYSYNYSGVLPIKLMSFEAFPELDKVNLKWQVSLQEDINSYEIEWRTGPQEFQKIGVINSKTSQNSVLIYDFLHETAVPGNNYYRLKIINSNGTFEYSNVITVKRTPEFKVYPNPATSYVKINTDNVLPVGSELKLINSMGIIVRQQLTDSNIVQHIELGGLTPGMYYIQLIDAANKDTSVHPIIIE